MNHFYFGDSNKPLLGVYHPPKNQNLNEGVVLCYPQAREYEITHWAFRHLADMLAKAGFHVLRFDYSGAGDSAGDYESVSLEQWKSDIRIAMEELKDTAWVKKVSLVGVRLGANLAGLAAENLEVKNLVLWDPVVNGKDYIKELRILHDRIINGSSAAMTGPDELVGYPASPELVSAIEEIDLTNNFQSKAEKTFLVVSSENPGILKLRAHLTQKGNPFEYRFSPDSLDWENMGPDWNMVFATNILRAITESVAGVKL